MKQKSGGSGGGGNGMKLPFDAQEATRSIVRVMRSPKNGGCGFVAAGRYVITAGHCLPRRPAHTFDDQFATTVKSWDSNDETKLVVIYHEVISDIAVLRATLDRDKYTDAFDRLVARTGSASIDLSFPVEMPLRFYIRTHSGRWLTGSTDVLFSLGPAFCAFIDEGKKIPGGTSGSPVFNQKGEVMGLVCKGSENDVEIAWLAGALQWWLIRELSDWRSE